MVTFLVTSKYVNVIARYINDACWTSDDVVSEFPLKAPTTTQPKILIALIFTQG